MQLIGVHNLELAVIERRGSDPGLKASAGPTRLDVSADPSARNVEDSELGASEERGPGPHCATVCGGEGPR